MRLAFGEYVLDRERRLLVRGGREVRLPPNAFHLLELLIDERPRALPKEQLHHDLWPDSIVTESSLANLVAQVRNALGESGAEPRFVRTVHGFGYAFEGEVRDLASRPAASGTLACRIRFGDREIALSAGTSLIGRLPSAAVWIQDPNVSRRHAQILVGADAVVLEDLGSHNGTYLRGVRISSPEPLRNEDEIRVGPARLIVQIGAADDSTWTSIDAGTTPGEERSSIVRRPASSGS